MSGMPGVGLLIILLRLARIGAGAVGVLALLSSCTQFARGPEGTPISVARIVAGLLLLGLFALLRWLVNRLSAAQTGAPHPALRGFWNL